MMSFNFPQNPQFGQPPAMPGDAPQGGRLAAIKRLLALRQGATKPVAQPQLPPRMPPPGGGPLG